MIIDEIYNNVTEDDFNKPAFVIFARALLAILKDREGVIVDTPKGNTVIVWHRKSTGELVVTENVKDVPTGTMVWVDDEEKVDGGNI
jgi:hypothetical protein